jgi:hypothetical protein
MVFNGTNNVCEYMEWITLAQDRMNLRAIVNTVMNLRVP